MSVVGFDVGNQNCIVGVARQRGIDVVLNDESSRETPAMVSFGEKQRFLGSAAAATATMNPKNTISQVKRLIGRKFKDPEVQNDLHFLPFVVSEGPDGGPLIHVQHMNERSSFTPTQILGMILSNLKSIAEKALNSSVADCVIGIPAHFSELQRRAYLDAAAIAGLHPLRLMHETTAAALAYGLYKSDLPSEEEEEKNDEEHEDEEIGSGGGSPFNVAFVDVGHSSMQVCVVAFTKGHVRVLGQAWDRSLGGRDFDEVLFEHFVEKLEREQELDVRSNMRACQRLRAACEKMKKVLSANAEASLSIECLMDEKDVRGHMKREEFEQLAGDLLDRVRLPCERAIAEAGVGTDRISAVEVIGSGSRIPAVLKIIGSCFGTDPGRTLNASECIARGCTLQCAMLSPTFKVRHFEVHDCFPFPIALSWKVPAASYGDCGGTGGGDKEARTLVFPKGNAFPSAKILIFHRTGPFQLESMYANMNEMPPGMSSKIATYQIGPFKALKPEKAVFKVKLRLNLNAMLELEQATLLEEDEVEVLTVKQQQQQQQQQQQECNEASAISMDTEIQRSGRSMPDGHETDSNVAHAENIHCFQRNEQTSMGAENANSRSERVETDTMQQPEMVRKPKSRKTNVAVQESVLGGLSAQDLQRAVEKESDMALQDRVMIETKEKKNAVETYVYEMRNKLSETLQYFTTDREREDLAAKLQQTEFWLYEDGEDEPKSVYVAKLAELKKLGDPFMERQKEDEARGPAVRELLACIQKSREVTTISPDHITASEKDKVLLECKKAEEWLRVKKQQQDSLSKSSNPVLLASDMKTRAESLDRICKPIMCKARPSSGTVPPHSRPSTTSGASTAAGAGARATSNSTTSPRDGKDPFTSGHHVNEYAQNTGSNNNNSNDVSTREPGDSPPSGPNDHDDNSRSGYGVASDRPSPPDREMMQTE